MYNFVSSRNHIFVSCQHTAIKFSKRYWFLGSFSSGFDKFSPTYLFQKLTKPFKGGWPCIDGFGYYFRVPWGCMKQWSVWWRFCALQKWQKRFVCLTKIFYFKCHRSRYFEYIKNFSCEKMYLFEQRFWLAAWCGPLRKQPSHPSHMITKSGKPLKNSTGSPKVSSRGLISHELKYVL